MAFDLERINKRFRKAGEKILSLRWFFVVLLLVVTSISVVGVQKVELNSSWDSWFMEDDPVMKAKHRFEDIFGNSDAGAILVEADDVFSHDVLKMIRNLTAELESGVPFVDKVVSLSDFEFSSATGGGIRVGDLVPEKIPVKKSELEKIRKQAFSKTNLVNRLFSDDSKETWIHIRLKEIPDSFKAEAKVKGVEPLFVIGEKIRNIVKQDKYSKFSLKDTGMPAIALDKTNFFKKESARVVMLAVLAAIIVLILFLRSLRGVLVPLITTLSAIFISYGGMGFLGVKIDASMVTVPIYLALAVSIGYSIHILNFFKRRFIETGDRRESILYSIEHTGWPLFFTALTTIGCMLAFNFAAISSIRWIGNASASMVAIVYLFVMVLNPVLLSFGKDGEPHESLEGDDSYAIKSDRIFEKLGDFVLGNPRKIVVLSLITVAVLGYGMKNVVADFEPFKSFGLKVPYVQRLYDVTHSKIGTMYSYNLMIELPKNGQAKEPEILKKFEKLESEVMKLPLSKNSMSILDVVKDMNRTMHGNSEAYYRVPDKNDLVSQLLLLYENSGGQDAEYWLDYDYRILRLQVGMTEFKASEVERELAVIEKMVKGYFPKARFGMVGTSVEGAVVNNYIARGQVETFIIALFIIGILMIIVFRSVKAGLIGLVPNMMPVFVIGGIMGYFDLPLDMMSMTIVPMLMGIAVDDSIHFVNHLKLEVERGVGYEEAIHRTFRTVGKALFMTSLILIVTFGMYVTSDVNMFKVLGMLVAFGLISALVADYLLTPVLIRWAKPFRSLKRITDEELIEADAVKTLCRENISNGVNIK